MSLCCSDDLPEKIRTLADKSKEGFVRVMPFELEGVNCDCGKPPEFNISYQNKEGGYVWPRTNLYSHPNHDFYETHPNEDLNI